MEVLIDEFGQSLGTQSKKIKYENSENVPIRGRGVAGIP